MDAAGPFPPDLLAKLFDLGLMGIEIPEEFGGQGGTFFQSVLAVEEIAAVDPAAAVIVDVQNTLVMNAFLRWGTDDQKRNTCPAWPKIPSGRMLYRKPLPDRTLSHSKHAPSVARMTSRLRPQTLDHQCSGGRSLPGICERRSGGGS